MEATTTTIPPASNPSGGSPVTTTRDASQTPGRDTMQPQPAETNISSHYNSRDRVHTASIISIFVITTSVGATFIITTSTKTNVSDTDSTISATTGNPISSSWPVSIFTSSPTTSILPRAPIYYSLFFKYTATFTNWTYPPTKSFKRDLSLLADAVQQSCPEAVRRTIRDKWEKCITGSEFHHAFIMNAIIHHASGAITRRAIRDFGKNLVSQAKLEIAAHLRPQDIDDMAPAILEKCSENFLDKALEQRLKTIDARSLINALARAERLGPPPAAPAEASLLFQTQPAQNVPPTSDLKCRLCWRQFQHTKPYEYHVQKQLCIKAKSDQYQFWCEECGAGFATKVGQQYHNANAVCGLHVTAAATPKSQAIPGLGVIPATKYTRYIPHTPAQPNAGPMEAPSPSQDDPYSHLTPQRRAELEEELLQAEMSYGPRFKEAEQMADPMARRSKIESLQNTFSTKQSIIRKKYGVRLRVRRSRAVIEEERLRIGLKHGTSSTVEAPSAKRQRSDDGSDNLGQTSYVSRGPQVQTTIPPPANLLSVSQMNNSGLGGSTATAATTDPTASAAPSQPPPASEQPPPNSLSSLQRKGYRVSSHVGQAAHSASGSPIQGNGSASTPVVLDSSSDGTDTDEDIPSTIPPKKNL
ncbi:hypothetical protein E0Z10_g740 [Xylaria hypoxylon]|uniref:Uncharacterized protein n=1 Tax=Xylaria hypoxylon TaxID=37992 RepID=A0A4Z0Z8Z6_9PEZI|nr:hypothetical protein E0Z10_g740 [Xylaria hypoxylon]